LRKEVTAGDCFRNSVRRRRFLLLCASKTFCERVFATPTSGIPGIALALLYFENSEIVAFLALNPKYTHKDGVHSPNDTIAQPSETIRTIYGYVLPNRNMLPWLFLRIAELAVVVLTSDKTVHPHWKGVFAEKNANARMQQKNPTLWETKGK
jgi:hypothetical protein